MRTKHHYPTLLIALLLGLMMTTSATWAQGPTFPYNNDELDLNSTETDISVTWYAAKDDQTPQEQLEYWIYVANDPDLLKDPYRNKDIPSVNSQEGPIMITKPEEDDAGCYRTTCYYDGRPNTIVGSLRPGTLYYVVVAVVDGDDNVSYYKLAVVRTGGKNADTEAPETKDYVDGYPKAVSPTEIEVKWNPAKDNVTAPEKLEYQVEWTLGSWEFKYGSDFLHTCEYKIRELKPNTEYKVVVKVMDKGGNTASYGVKTVKTPPPPDTEKPKSGGYVDGYPKAVSPTEIEVKWNPGTDEGGTAQEDLEYEVAWVIPSSGDESDWDGADRSSTLHTCEYKIRGLNPNTEYLVDVMVLDKANNATWYGEKTIKTPAAETPKPDPEPKPEPGPGETVLVSSVMLDQPKVSIDGDRASFQLKASVLPANATNSELQWSSSNPSVASVEAASTASLLKAGVTGKAVTVHIHKKGKAEITAQAMDGSGKSASCQVNVLSTVGNIEAAATRIYASGSTLRLTLPQAAVVRIYNVSGALVHMLNASAGDTSVALSAGVYVVRVGDTVQKVRIE